MYERIARPRNLFSFFLLFWCYDSSSVCTPDEKKRWGGGGEEISVRISILPAKDRSGYFPRTRPLSRRAYYNRLRRNRRPRHKEIRFGRDYRAAYTYTIRPLFG